MQHTFTFVIYNPSKFIVKATGKARAYPSGARFNMLLTLFIRVCYTHLSRSLSDWSAFHMRPNIQHNDTQNRNKKRETQLNETRC
jgi:hypothetical protein